MPAPIFSALVLALGLALSACQGGGTTMPAAPAPSNAPAGVTPSTFSMPSGSGCSGEVARFQAVIDNDLSTGHTTKGVWEQVSALIAAARSTCANGNDSAATAQIRAAKARFGYP